MADKARNPVVPAAYSSSQRRRVVHISWATGSSGCATLQGLKYGACNPFVCMSGIKKTQSWWLFAVFARLAAPRAVCRGPH